MTMLPCFLLFCAMAISCRNDIEKVRLFDKQDLPQQSIDNVTVMRSTSGNAQMALIASKVMVFTTPQRKTVYPEGISMRIFDSHRKTVATVNADYACSYDDKNMVEARNNVVIVDFRSGDTSYLNSIVWNSSEHRIYSDDTIKSVNGQRVTYGDGFESDDNFNEPRILHQRGTITFDDE